MISNTVDDQKHCEYGFCVIVFLLLSVYMTFSVLSMWLSAQLWSDKLTDHVSHYPVQCVHCTDQVCLYMHMFHIVWDFNSELFLYSRFSTKELFYRVDADAVCLHLLVHAASHCCESGCSMIVSLASSSVPSDGFFSISSSSLCLVLITSTYILYVL